MLQNNFFSSFFVFPILNLLAFFYKVFLSFKIPGAFGFAIIGLTVFIRSIFQPFFKQQLETSKKMQELKPRLDKLMKKYKNDQQTLQKEQLKLYQEAGINPTAGCFIMIIQFPIFFALYNTLSLFLMNGQTTTVIDQINKVLYFQFLKIKLIDPWFFGFNLVLSPKASGQWFYLLIPFLTGILQYFQTVSITSSNKDTTDSVIQKDGKKIEKEKNDNEDFQKIMTSQMKYMFPAMIGFFSYTLPVGLSLYWNIFSLFSIIQGRKLKVKN